MAKFTITIPDDKVQAVINSFASQYKYSATIEGENGETLPNPLSKAAFTKSIIQSFIKEVYVANQLKNLEAQRKILIEAAKSDVESIDVT